MKFFVLNGEMLEARSPPSQYLLAMIAVPAASWLRQSERRCCEEENAGALSAAPAFGRGGSHGLTRCGLAAESVHAALVDFESRGGRGRGDDQGQDDEELLHFRVPFTGWAFGVVAPAEGLLVRSERLEGRVEQSRSANTLSLWNR